MKKLIIVFICLVITLLMLGAAKAYAFHYTTANSTPYSALTGKSNNLESPNNETNLYTFDLLSFLKIEQSDFGSLQMYNGKVYIREGLTYKIYQLDPHTGQYAKSVSADNLGAEMAGLLNQMFSPQENKQVLEKININYTELIQLALNLLAVIVWLPTAYISASCKD